MKEYDNECVSVCKYVSNILHTRRIKLHIRYNKHICHVFIGHAFIHHEIKIIITVVLSYVLPEF